MHGDKNTNFFHQKTIVRRWRNRIETIQDNSRKWLYNGEEICDHAVGYFSFLFKSEAAIYQVYHAVYQEICNHAVAHYSAATSQFVQVAQIWNRDVFGNIFLENDG